MSDTNKPNRLSWRNVAEFVVIAWVAWVALKYVPYVGGLLRTVFVGGLIVAAAHVYVPGGLIDRAYCALRDKVLGRTNV
jgi:hypothetical protein